MSLEEQQDKTALDRFKVHLASYNALSAFLTQLVIDESLHLTPTFNVIA